MNRLSLKQNRPKVLAFLAEIGALTNAHWFIGTFSSNVARTVHVLRDRPQNTSVSLDDRWAPGVAWHTFGKPYCFSPNANKKYCALL